MAYATGKYSYGLCDYCGQRYPYKTLRKNWRGFKVCPSDYEPKEPQLEPLKYKGDAIALLEPRPDRVEPVDVYIGQPGYTYFQSIGSANNVINMRPFPSQDTPHGVGGIGNVFIFSNSTVILTAGVAGSAFIGAVSVDSNSAQIDQVAPPALVGQVGATFISGTAPSIAVSGVDSSAELSSVSVSLVQSVPSSGVFSSGSIGNVVVPDVSLLAPGVDGSGEVGNPSVTTS